MKLNFVDYIQLDQKVCQLAGAIEANVLSYINPQNIVAEKKKFFEELEKGNEYNPKFMYPSRNPFYSYFSMAPTFETHKRELAALLEQVGQDSLGLIFERKISDLFERMELLKSVGTPNFSNNSEEYYGKVNNKLVKIAKELVTKKVKIDKEKVTFVEAKRIIDNFIKSKKIPYRVVERESTGSKFAVNIRTKELKINSDARLTKESVKRLIAHEIETHAYKYENGSLQPYALFARGLSKEMLETEEGLAVIVEESKGINCGSQLKNYAGRVIAINSAKKKSFYGTFKELEQFFSNSDAFNLTLRAKRGTFKTSGKGAFSKDALYLKGRFEVEKFFEDGGKLEELYLGRYSVYDYPLVKDVDGLKKPKFLPEVKKISYCPV
jgi:uncharacterized protein (TIGR02421 family)